jgi:hypothetical protein
LQVLLKIGLHERKKPIVRPRPSHHRLRGESRRRRNRCEAVASSWGVAVRYVSVPRMS